MMELHWKGLRLQPPQQACFSTWDQKIRMFRPKFTRAKKNYFGSAPLTFSMSGEEDIREYIAPLGYSSRLGLLGCWAVIPLYSLKQPGLRLNFNRADRKISKNF